MRNRAIEPLFDKKFGKRNYEVWNSVAITTSILKQEHLKALIYFFFFIFIKERTDKVHITIEDADNVTIFERSAFIFFSIKRASQTKYN